MRAVGDVELPTTAVRIAVERGEREATDAIVRERLVPLRAGR